MVNLMHWMSILLRIFRLTVMIGRRNQRRQPNVCRGIHGNSNGDGGSIAGASSNFNDPIGQHNNDLEGQNIRLGLILAKLGVARALNRHFLMSVSPRWLLL
mmetsp:Transcript_3637/g.5604  ORF Transcript_3637/g.5604 Transcript_3637/m.5604 type:complete len:101 (-) Transcript_3637:172-474(-)